MRTAEAYPWTSEIPALSVSTARCLSARRPSGREYLLFLATGIDVIYAGLNVYRDNRSNLAAPGVIRTEFRLGENGSGDCDRQHASFAATQEMARETPLPDGNSAVYPPVESPPFG